MSKPDEIKVPVFDGQDYALWKKRILLFLNWKKCQNQATREKVTGDKEPEWEDGNIKAMNYIYSSISNKQLEFVGEETTALKILQKLDKLYLKESTALQIIVRNRLDKLKLKDYDNSDLFFLEFEQLINKLKAAGATLKESEKLDYLLKTLPDSLSYLGDIIDTLKEEDRICDYVKNKIYMSETKYKYSNNNNIKSSVFKTEIRDVECNKCHKRGHYARECRSQMRGGASQRARWPGGGQNYHQQQQQQNYHHHKQQQQFQRRENDGGYPARGYSNNVGRGYDNNHRNFSRGRGYSERGNGSRGRGRGWYQPNARYSYNESEDSRLSETFLTRLELNKENECRYESRNKNCNNVCMNGLQKVDWILDSGCSDHIINDKSYFVEHCKLDKPVFVKVGDGRPLKVTEVGKVLMYLYVDGVEREITVSNVFLVKEMDRNLLSYARITDNYKIVSIQNQSLIYNRTGKVIGIAKKENGLYILESYILKQKSYSYNTNKITDKEKFHRMLGHINFNYLNMMCKENFVDGLPKSLENVYLKCGTCIQNKMHNLPFENNRSRAKEILEIVHTDVNGPHHNTGYDGSKYFVTFLDDYSKCSIVYTIKSKHQVYTCLLDYINKVENYTGKKIKILRCDNGKEYLNNDIFNLIREKGIIMDKCPPYVHELNGTAERFNRTIVDSARCLLADANLNIRYWPEVVLTASYLKTRTIANTVEKKSLYEIFFGKRPNIANLKLYGCKVFVRTPESKRNSKWDRKSDVGILVGYENVGYRILMNNKITVARHVDFVNENETLVGFDGKDESDCELEDNDDNSIVNDTVENKTKESPKSKMSPKVEIKRNPSTDNEEFVDCNEQESEVRRSDRERKKPDRFGDSEVYYIYVNYVSAHSPRTYDEALSSSESDLWKNAMKREIDCINKNNTWKLVNRPKGKKVIDVKWVFTNKANNLKKARLVVRGFQQKEILEDIYSPVARLQTLKLLLAFCVQNKYLIEQMDVETAFLNGKIKSEVYVKQPNGYSDGTDRVYKLEKALYGLRESPRAWYECFDKFIISLNFQRSNSDYCLYIFENENGENIYIILFVDDLLICGKNKEKINKIKFKLQQRFSMKDMGKVKTYLGINIVYNYKNEIMTLDLSEYIESLAKHYRIVDSKLYNTPMEQNLNIEPAQSVSSDLKYRNLIGALLYISTCTRCDISYSVNYLSRYQNCYGDTHYKYALRVLKYLYLTKDLKLKFKRNLTAEILDCYVDADWAGDSEDRKPTTGFVIRFCGNVIYWKTKKQNSVTKSSTSAEYVALSEAVSEIKFIKSLLNDLKIDIDFPIKIHEDNSGTVLIAKFGNLTKRSKYIEIHYHFVNECYDKKEIDIVKVDTEKNLADIFTKALGRIKFEKLRLLLNLKD